MSPDNKTTVNQTQSSPTWRPFQDFPEAVQKGAQTAERCKISYRTHLDAVRFFYECDRLLAMTDDKGELLHFPISRGTCGWGSTPSAYDGILIAKVGGKR